MRGPETITSVTITVDVKGASFTDEHRCVDFTPEADAPERCDSCFQPEAEHHAKTEQSVTWGVKYVLAEAHKHIAARGITALDNQPLLDINGQTVGRIIIEREEDES
jgi:hypothetical protein